MSASDLDLMRRIDELHLEHPFMGTRISGISLPVLVSKLVAAYPHSDEAYGPLRRFTESLEQARNTQDIRFTRIFCGG